MLQTKREKERERDKEKDKERDKETSCKFIIGYIYIYIYIYIHIHIHIHIHVTRPPLESHLNWIPDQDPIPPRNNGKENLPPSAEPRNFPAK